jgi:hypothetical protein
MKHTLKTTYLQEIRTKTGMLAAQHNLRPIERATTASHTSQARRRAMSAIAGTAWHGYTLPVVGELNHVAESKANVRFGVRKKGTDREGKEREGGERGNPQSRRPESCPPSALDVHSPANTAHGSG